MPHSPDRKNEAESLIATLRQDDLEVRRGAERALAAIGDAAVDPLIEALTREQDTDLRWYISRALARIGPGAVIPLLRLLRGDADPDAKRYASAALAAIGEPAVQPLVDVLLGEDREMRGHASRVLCAIGLPAIPHLRRAMESASPLQRRSIELTLLRIDETGIQTVVDMYTDSSGNRA